MPSVRPLPHIWKVWLYIGIYSFDPSFISFWYVLHFSFVNFSSLMLGCLFFERVLPITRWVLALYYHCRANGLHRLLSDYVHWTVWVQEWCIPLVLRQRWRTWILSIERYRFQITDRWPCQKAKTTLIFVRSTAHSSSMKTRLRTGWTIWSWQPYWIWQRMIYRIQRRGWKSLHYTAVFGGHTHGLWHSKLVVFFSDLAVMCASSTPWGYRWKMIPIMAILKWGSSESSVTGVMGMSGSHQNSMAIWLVTSSPWICSNTWWIDYLFFLLWRCQTAVFKNQIDWIPLTTGSIRPTQGRTLAIVQVCGGSQSFNTVNSLLILGRWMRMFTIPNQSSIPKAYTHFPDEGQPEDQRLMPSGNGGRLVDCMEEFVEYTILMRLTLVSLLIVSTKELRRDWKR